MLKQGMKTVGKDNSFLCIICDVNTDYDKNQLQLFYSRETITCAKMELTVII